jgi:hypothetical protein
LSQKGRCQGWQADLFMNHHRIAIEAYRVVPGRLRIRARG